MPECLELAFKTFKKSKCHAIAKQNTSGLLQSLAFTIHHPLCCVYNVKLNGNKDGERVFCSSLKIYSVEKECSI